MSMNRRQFVAAGLSLLPLSRVLGRPFDGPFTDLRGNTGYFTGQGGTIGYLVDPDALVVIDTQFPATAEQCRSGLMERAGRSFDLVINTHHHGDHTSGNGVFKPHTKRILAHENVPELQRRATAGSDNAASQVFADTTFSDVWEEDIGGEHLRLKYYGPAHTSGDAVILFANANVAHMGDLVFNRTPPYIDRPAGASIRNWVTVLESTVNDLGQDTLFIFGHSHPDFPVTGSRDDLLVQRDFLTGLLEYVQKGISAGSSVEELIGVEHIPGFPDHQHPDRRNVLQNAIRTAYEELTADQ